MQRGAGDRRAGHVHGFQYRDRGHAPGAAHLHGDVEQLGVDLLRRVLVRDGPAWRARGRAQRALQREIVHLDDDAVERVLDVATMLAVIVDHRENLAERRDGAVVRRDRHTPLGIQRVGLRLVIHLIVSAGGVRARARTPAQRTEAMRVEAQSARGGDARILLAQRTGGRVARVRERGSARVLLLAVELVEVVPAHEHLAADLHELGDVVLLAAEVRGDGTDGAHIQGDVLAGHAIAAREPLLQHAVAVDEVQREPVDLHLAAHRQRLAFRPVEIADDRIVPVAELLEREHVVEAHHAARVAYGGEIVRERAAHPARGTLRVVERGERRLQPLQAAQARVIGRVGGDRGVVDVIGDLVGFHPCGDARPQACGILRVQGVDVESVEPRRIRVGGRQGGDPCLAARREMRDSLIGDDGRLRGVGCAVTGRHRVEIPCQLFVRHIPALPVSVSLSDGVRIDCTRMGGVPTWTTGRGDQCWARQMSGST